ncbi:hypothetical protein [Terrabacter sp. 2RAF25]|uniref:hypothetical protein n=1 Tax=Terrabacter sp. 2RAF25 TaxID=3232998 RepID=UPI003F9A12AE
MTTPAVTVRALDVVVRIDLGDPGLLPAIEQAWHLCLAEDHEPDAVVRVPDHDGTPDSVARSLQLLTQSVTLAAIGARAGRDVMLHAGGLSHPVTGASIAYVAPGGTGKTTVTTTLGRGRGYLSDETVAVRCDGAIVSYPKPLSIRRPDGGIKDETAPGALGLAAACPEPWLAGIVALRRDLAPGSPIDVVDVPILDALVMLAPESSSLARLDGPLRRLADVVEMGGGLRLVHFAEARQLEPLVAGVLGRSR